jgi:hypothetical protein
MVSTTLLLDIIDVLNVAGTFETKAAAIALMKIVEEPKTVIEDASERMSIYVSDKDLMLLYDDIIRSIGSGKWFLSRDVADLMCGPKYIYMRRGSESLRVGILLPALKSAGFVTSKHGGKGMMKWMALKKA